MGEDPQVALAVLSSLPVRTQSRTQDAFVLRNGAFHLPAMAVDPAGKSPLHLSSIFGARPGRRVSARIERDHRRTNPELLAAELMVRLRVVGHVGEHTVPVDHPRGLVHRLGEEGIVVAGTATDHRGGPQMAGGMADHGQLGPELLQTGLLTASEGVIVADVSDFEARGIDGAFRALVDQAERAGTSEDGGQKRLKSPFFCRRCSA